MSTGLLHSVVLGIVQGLTEFLPISSSAHLILIPRYFQWEDPGLAFDVALHLGTLVGVLIYFWKDLLGFVYAFFPGPASDTAANQENRRMVGLLMWATIPGALVGFLLERKADALLRSPLLIATDLAILGLLLGLADWFSSGKRTLKDLTVGAAIGMGFAQSLALIPGVSRSGITITVALALGLQRREAARFSFLMSIPIIAGAGILKFKQILHSPDHMALAAGFVAAAVSGLLAISILMRFVQNHRYTPFVIYRWVLAAFVLANLPHFQ
jgi:undecaprenyl-diphosphatase